MTLFEELVGIVDREELIVSNAKVRDIIFSWGSNVRETRVVRICLRLAGPLE